MEKANKAKTPYHFIYNGVEYDATSYAEKHPGGESWEKGFHRIF